MRKSIKSVMAFALAASMIASTVAPAATVSAASKVNVITKATYNSGSTVKYTYNGKGLVTKSVSTSSSKDNDSDTTTTVTTTFKYNKKNKVSTKTEKYVTKTTSYEVDKTTGLKLGAKKGTVTETDTYVTNYTYDKKGLATQSVTTHTAGKSGSITETDKTRFHDGNSSYGYEMSDGRILAGYNRRNADGTENYENTSNNAYYYEGNVADTESLTTSTTTYTDNGNGSYTEAVSSTTSSAGYKSEPVEKYYYEITTDGVKSIIPLTKTEKKSEDGDTYTVYTGPDGKEYYGYSFIIKEKITLTKDPASNYNYTDNSQNTVSGKSVTTTKYTYDKKKRVKKEVITTVTTKDTSNTETTSSVSASSDSSSKRDNTTKSESKYESTSVSMITYTYDKKGRATKKVVSNDGKTESKSVSSNMTTSTSSENTYFKADGTVSSKSTSSESFDTYPTTTTTVISNGVKTVTTTSNPYTRTYSNSDTYASSSDTTSGTEVYTSYGNGGRKTVNTSTSTYTDNNAASNNHTTTSTNTSYTFDEYGKSYGNVRTSTTTFTGSTPSENSSASYYDGTKSYYNVDATVKIDAAKAALEATGTPYNKTVTKTALAEPSKSTTTYKYDKNGNVKSAKESRTTTEIKTVQNETYGNPIYEWDAVGKIQPKQIAVTHKYTDNDAMENTVKKGTKVLTKKLAVNKYTHDRYSQSGSSLYRVLFTLKAKKSSTAKLVKKQQWIIQNGALNGEVGLD